MRKFKAGDTVCIIRPVCVRKKSGNIEVYQGCMVKVVKVGFDSCFCDIGLNKPVYIPKTHLRMVA
jgi:hypothetical protein